MLQNSMLCCQIQVAFFNHFYMPQLMARNAVCQSPHRSIVNISCACTGSRKGF